MRARFSFCFFCIFILFAPCNAQAARFSGAYLLQLCDRNEDGSPKDDSSPAACQAYIAGVVDYHDVLQSMDLAPKVDICIPEKITSAELQTVVLEYLHKNPQHDSFVAAPAVTLALYEVFPCKSK